MSGVAPKIDVAWTADQEDFVRSRWADGDSATQIGVVLGRSRNSICSKLSRLGLLKTRPTPAKNLRRTPPRRVAKPAKTMPLLPIAKSGDKAILRSSVWDALAGTAPVALEDLGHNMCKWPIGDRPFRFCGAHADQVYCETHQRISRHG